MNDNPFFGINFEDLYRSGFWQTEKDPVLEQCKKDAIEYFGNEYSDKWFRTRLTKVQKDRVVAFLKNRKKYYDENGFLLDKNDK